MEKKKSKDMGKKEETVHVLRDKFLVTFFFSVKEAITQ